MKPPSSDLPDDQISTTLSHNYHTAWFRRRSRASLVSSAVCSFLLLLAFVLSFWFPVIAFSIGAIVALNLAINFAVRLQATRKFMPAGRLILHGVIN